MRCNFLNVCLAVPVKCRLPKGLRSHVVYSFIVNAVTHCMYGKKPDKNVFVTLMMLLFAMKR